VNPSRGAAIAERDRMMRSWLVLGSLLVAGCNLYFGGDDQPPPPCNYGDDIYEPLLRNPQTGECESFGWGGGTCSDQCPCPGTANGGAVKSGVAMPDWASCGGACDALDEKTCLATAGCHAEYTGFECPPNADCTMAPATITFWTCSAVAPSGPQEGGDCWSLDAQTCSEHDDCATTYQPPAMGWTEHTFNQCIPEPGQVDACAGVDCGAGSHCEQQCYPCDKSNPNDTCMGGCSAVCVPDADSCATVDCAPGTHCEVQCNGPICDPGPNGCPPQTCVVSCVPDAVDPGDCYQPVTCNSAPPACPAGTTPGVANGCYTGFCIPVDQCTHDPGTCDWNGVMCDLAPPACPMGTEPGVKNGCWSGYCIPDWACASTQPCASITDEKTCVSRSDCTPIYDGTHCTCDPSGCVCQDKTFARCEDAVPPPAK
jgi:hypothetical protein